MSVCGLPDVSAVSTFYEMDGIDYQVLNIVDYIMHITHPWADFPMVEIRDRVGAKKKGVQIISPRACFPKTYRSVLAPSWS